MYDYYCNALYYYSIYIISLLHTVKYITYYINTVQ